MRFVLSILGAAVVAASVTFAVAAHADKKSELEEAKAQAKAQAEQAATAKAGNAEAAMAGACMQWEVQKLATSKGAPTVIADAWEPFAITTTGEIAVRRCMAK